jgi:signal transduction histidine kinase
MINAPPGSPVILSRWQRYLRARPWVIDVTVALVSVFIAFPGITVGVDGAPVPAPRWPGYLLTGMACAALVWVRSRPRVIAAVTTTCATVLAALGYTLSPLLLAPVMVALFFVALHTSQKAAYAYAVTAITILECTAVIASPHREPLAMEIIGTAAWLLLPVPLGITARLRTAYTEAAHARAEYAERTKEEEARHRVAEERMRIARELHDVIAHHLTLANAQAGTVIHLMGTEPASARKMAADLNGTIVTALDELKATVGLLRQAGDPESPLEPAPGLAQLPGLAGSFGSAGLTVTVTTEGKPQPLPPATDLTAFRIIQEALTNVTKHAATSQAQVRLAYAGGRLGITVSNDSSGPPPSAPGPGYGLIGMRERALSAGGRLRAGHRPAGGFEVAAELPLPPSRPHQEQSP